ncbi:MAG: hypothetical protein JHC31_13280 [Sulfurihydrogenibium sp.]|jgi:hypothetical protein|nr:hypothetical protein [Sulfurihydrogenibium sp.]
MKTVITAKKEDLLKLFETALEKQEKRKILKEKCHFDIVVTPSNDPDDDNDYYMYIEYFTSPYPDNNDNNYESETCKINYEIPVAVTIPPELEFIISEKPQIYIGLIEYMSIEKAINKINEIDDDLIEIEIYPSKIQNILSYSIIENVKDHITSSSKT